MPAYAATYAYRADVFAYDTPSGSAASVVWHTTSPSPSCTQYPSGDDDWADVAFPSGFTFRFGGTSYSSVRVYSNGILAFPPDVSGFHRDFTSQALPITAGPGAYTGCPNAVPQNLMVAYWLDIVAGTANGTAGASVRYELLGAAPNRRFVISWVNVKLYNTTTRYNFQVVLQESLPGVNGNFKYQYTTGSSTGANAAVGVQLSTTDFTQYAFNQSFIDTTLGTAILWYPANQLAAKKTEYRFDEGSWAGAAGEIKDTSGNLLNASRSSNNVANVAAGKLCRGATFTNNTSNATIDAVATPVVPANQGSVGLWYRSNNAWNSADTMLLDASTAAARPFFLLKRSNGSLRFSITDSAGTVITANTTTNYTFGAGTWHHIAVSWSLRAGTNQTVLQIMVDGVLATTTTTTPYRTTSSGTIASLGPIYVGDNRTAGVTPTGGSANGANGTIDEVYIYEVDINETQAAADAALTRTNCTTLDHFHIVHSGEVVNCGGAVANVTIEAHDANHALFTLAGTSVALSTSTGHGTWSSVSAINPVSGTAGTGAGSYTFANESSVVLGLSNTFSESLNINLNSGGITESSGVASSCTPADYTFGSSCDTNLVFAQAGFQFDVPHHVAETSASLSLRAIKQSDSSTACVPLFANTSRDIIFKCSYANPATGTLPVRAGGVALNTSNSIASQCDATGQPVSLAFNAVGVATTTVQYADVGNMTLTAQNTEAGVTMSGTDTFITAPKDFAFSAITAAPIKAGVNFSATVTARNNAGAATPNFGKESTAQGVVLSFTKYQPTGVGTANGSFTGTVVAFNAGAATGSNLSWSEVGTIDLTATLASGNYLSSGLTATGTTGTTGGVGRFIPHHFDTVVTQGCTAGNFTYSAQPFAVVTTARNLANATTVNYAGATWAKAVTLSNAGVLTNLSANTLAATDFTSGVGTAASVQYSFPSATTLPLTLTLRALDTDAVSSSGFAEGGTTIRSGRIQLQNAYGSELLALPVPLAIQFWNNGWAQNVADTCTVLAADQFAWVFPPGAAPRLNTLAACEAAATVTGVGPNYIITLNAPGAANAGWADLTLNLGAAAGSTCTAANVGTGYSGLATTAAAPWLRFNWTGVVANPAARVTFGSYRNRLIYRRENY